MVILSKWNSNFIAVDQSVVEYQKINMSCVIMKVLIPKVLKLFKRKNKRQDDDLPYEDWKFCPKYPENDKRSKNNTSKSSIGSNYSSKEIDYEGWEFSCKYPEVDKRSRSNWSKSSESLRSHKYLDNSSLGSKSVTSLSINSVSEAKVFGSLNLRETSTIKDFYSDDDDFEIYDDVYDDLTVMVI